jgi:hypothetical protein
VISCRLESLEGSRLNAAVPDVMNRSFWLPPSAKMVLPGALYDRGFGSVNRPHTAQFAQQIIIHVNKYDMGSGMSNNIRCQGLNKQSVWKRPVICVDSLG